MIRKIIFAVLTLVAVIYIISPIDFIPDIIPVVGWIDDLFVGLMGVIFAIKTFKE